MQKSKYRLVYEILCILLNTAKSTHPRGNSAVVILLVFVQLYLILCFALDLSNFHKNAPCVHIVPMLN